MIDIEFRKKIFTGYVVARMIGYGAEKKYQTAFTVSASPIIGLLGRKYLGILREAQRGVNIHESLLWLIAPRSAQILETPKPLQPLVSIVDQISNDQKVLSLFQRHEVHTKAYHKKFRKTVQYTQKGLNRFNLSLPPRNKIIFSPSLLEERGVGRLLKKKERFLVIVSESGKKKGYPEHIVCHELLHIALGGGKTTTAHMPKLPKGGPKGYESAKSRTLANEYFTRALEYLIFEEISPQKARKELERSIKQGFVHLPKFVTSVGAEPRLTQANNVIRRIERVLKENRLG